MELYDEVAHEWSRPPHQFTMAPKRKAVSPFDKKVYALCSKIPPGRVSTYGSIATELGSCARAVGGALRRNPFAPMVPCHRVIASSLDLGGFNGETDSNGPALSRKRQMLAEEGVQFHAVTGRVKAACVHRFGEGDFEPPQVDKVNRTMPAAETPFCQRIVGVDWSGAKDAEDRIFLAQGQLARGAAPGDWLLQVDRLDRARDLSEDEKGAKGLAGACGAVVGTLRTLAEGPGVGERVACGVDAPLGLPLEFTHLAVGSSSGPSRWRDLVEASDKLWPSAEALRHWAAGLSTDCREPKRVCDVAAKVPFAPTNLRLYRQTWSAIVLLLPPLLRLLDDRVAVVPMMGVTESTRLVVVESCPASLLKRAALYVEPYKGSSAAERRARENIAAAMEKTGVPIGGPCAGRGALRLALPAAIRDVAMSQAGGDALDAILAAAATACGVLRPSFPAPVEGVDMAHAVEGAVYY